MSEIEEATKAQMLWLELGETKHDLEHVVAERDLAERRRAEAYAHCREIASRLTVLAALLDSYVDGPPLPAVRPVDATESLSGTSVSTEASGAS